MSSTRVGLYLGLASLLAGCFGNEETLFPAGLEPLEENAVALPEGTAGDPYPAGIVLEGVDGPRWDTVYARGYLDAPLPEVWAAFQDPLVGTDRRSADEWTIEPLGDPAYDAGFVIHSTTYDIVTVEWTTVWRQGVVEGTVEAPDLVAIRWQKTEGSTILRRIEGSAILRATPDGARTELDLVYRVDALAAGLDQFLLYVEDTLAEIDALLRGEPLPTYD